MSWTSFWVTFQVLVNRYIPNQPAALTKCKYFSFLMWPLTEALMIRLPSWKPALEYSLSSFFAASPKVGLFLPCGPTGVLRNAMMILLVAATTGYGISKVPILHSASKDTAFADMQTADSGIARRFVNSIVVTSPLVFSLVAALHKMRQFHFTAVVLAVFGLGYGHLLKHVRKRASNSGNDKEEWKRYLDRQEMLLSTEITFQNFHKYDSLLNQEPRGLSKAIKRALSFPSKVLMRHNNPILWGAFSASEYAGTAIYARDLSRLGLLLS